MASINVLRIHRRLFHMSDIEIMLKLKASFNTTCIRSYNVKFKKLVLGIVSLGPVLMHHFTVLGDISVQFMLPYCI
jgi:hypothetical protein